MSKTGFILLLVFSIAVGFASDSLQANGTISTMITADKDYCEGWKDGYCEGWKDVKGQLSICPIAPICPLAKIDCNKGYTCGYNRGFKAGMAAARER